MFKKSEKENKDNFLKIISKLINISKIDTVYRDIYLYRSREILSAIMPLEEYHNILLERKWLSQLPKKIHVALEDDDWKTVKELNKRMIALKQWEEENQVLFDIGDELYGTDEILMDPFSPGLNHLINIPSEDLPRLRDDIIKILNELQREDPQKKDFYLTRSNAFRSLSLIKLKKGDPKTAILDEVDLEERAQQALAVGDLELLDQIAELRLKQMGSKGPVYEQERSSEEAVFHKAPLTTQFSESTLANAEDLGMTAIHLDESKEYEALFRYAFHPVFEKDSEKAWEMVKKTEGKFPADLPEELKQHIELYAMHTFFNSGGSRYLPDFIAEDCLVELFPESSKSSGDQSSGLLVELGLNNRIGLSRKQIEHTLLQNGPRLLKDKLGLDPELFRLVCIPPDVYLRLGEVQGWGGQEIWTHFDGYQHSQKGKLMALAGGDVRFGGVYDLLGIGREYVSDHVLARFAVIQRKRMVSW